MITNNTKFDEIEKYNPASLEIDPNHPGMNDPTYTARRQYFFDLARKLRTQQQAIKQINFTSDEHALWQLINKGLDEEQKKYAWKVYLDGKKKLNIEKYQIPALDKINQILLVTNQFSLVPAEGLLHPYSFFSYLSNRQMPCTLFLRHADQPGYTPEPDMIHDLIGHVPALADKEYVELIELIGKGVLNATQEQLDAWNKIYWFTIEFGLIEEEGQVKAFGAGLLSSFAELQYAFSGNVTWKPFNLAEIIKTDYDTNRMQEILFVIPSVKVLVAEIKKFTQL